MSLDAILWALKNAPVIDAEERLILVTMAEQADLDGTNAWPSQATIAKRTLVSERTVRNRLRALEARGLIVRGDQRIVQHLRSDHRPIVWDLQIPFSYMRDLEDVALRSFGKEKSAELKRDLIKVFQNLNDLDQNAHPVELPTSPKKPRARAGARNG